MNSDLLQKRSSFISLKLSQLVRQLPTDIQPHFTDEVLANLTSSLLDGTIFEIVTNLSEMQQMSERRMYDERQRIVTEHARQRVQLLQRHRTTEKAWEVKPHQLSVVQAANRRELSAFDKRVSDELHRFDLKVVAEFDAKCAEQQETMGRVGVAGFVVSSSKDDVGLQMHVLAMIQKLNRMNIPKV
jgi:hypothetical protein